MIGTEFVKMCREDIETHKDREVLAMLLQAVETLINENPGCEVDPNKTIDGLWNSRVLSYYHTPYILSTIITIFKT